MNGWKQVVSDLAKTRRALLAGLLGLGLAVLCPGVVFATTGVVGPEAYVDSATDDGGGKIRVSWSLESEPEGVSFNFKLPGKVCVNWAVVEDGVRKTGKWTCFTSEVASQDDLVVDTGIGGDGPETVYSLILVPYYLGIPSLPKDENENLLMTEVTLNASA